MFNPLDLIIPVILSLLLSIVCIQCRGQKPDTEGFVKDPKFNDKIASMISFSVPLISVAELAKDENKFVLLDAREKNEYTTSHINRAIWVGYSHFDKSGLAKLDKNQPIVVYCSIGYRSESVAERVKRMGFKKVYNLYGSIFEWANQGNKLVTSDGLTTNVLHTYNKNWSKWVENPAIKKTW